MVTFTSAKSEAGVDELVSKIADLKNGSHAAKVRGDLSQIETPAKIIDATLSAFPGKPISILVNNAAVADTGTLAEIKPEDIASVWDVNLRGLLLMTQAVLPHLAKPGGRIVNIGSVGGRSGFAGHSLYIASKAALEGLTRVWAAELGPEGVTVNAVAPGPVETEMVNEISPELIKRQRETTPMEKRMGKLEDIAPVEAFLVEESSRWVTGQVINASGGYSMY